MIKKLILITIILSTLLLTTGCGKYGTGETIGYVYAVDDGILWDKVWYKSNLESSESDCYLIKNDNIKEQLKKISGKAKVKLFYDRHFMTIANCPEGTGTDDEITRFELIEENQ